MAKNIRSNYIKNLLADKDVMDASLRESTKDALKDIIDEAMNKNLRALISEADEDEYSEEEVNPKDELADASTESKDEEGKGENPFADNNADDTEKSSDNKGGEDEEAGGETAEISAEPEEDGEAGDDVWDSIEQYKDVDGEYDLTGMGSDTVVKVLQVMKPEDGIRVVKNDDGNITLTDDNNDTEYIIQLEADEPEEPEFEYELSVDDGVDESYSRINEYDSHVGYTDDYQKETAMTTPPNNEPANPKSTYSMDAGVPKGTEKPWAGKGDNSPFNHKVNEGEVDECTGEGCELEEGATSVAQDGPNYRGASMAHVPSNSKPTRSAREGSEAGEFVKPTTENPYESLKRKFNVIANENKQLKEIAGEIKTRLAEACTINASLGKIIKLITENTTTRAEKIDIVSRFNDVKSVSETNKLYETISKELKNAHPINNSVENAINGQQLSESKKTVVETSMYQSDDLAATRDFMRRLDSIK